MSEDAIDVRKKILNDDFPRWVIARYGECGKMALDSKPFLIGFMEAYLAELGLGIGLRHDVYALIRKGRDFIEIRYEQLADEIVKETIRLYK